ncbi:pentatricopeptide repeat-containing protein, chloroplastic [Iris pallida]|uniref:Receptor kinase-like protein Xa21 n=1 Tax=Iris pallida TaxID=29817 RepID=A0AAX6FXS5_IRIPA|nr:pentatricopeptide repeat-containing protein, chloroplastic [Iris pallida]
MCSSFLLCPKVASSSSTILMLLLLFFIIIPHHHHHLHVMSAPSILPPEHNNVTDRSSLLVFKSKISLDPHGVLLATWNDSLPFCHWPGVVCGHRHPERLVSLNLTSLDLVGSIPPHLANLTFLRMIDLSSNHFHGPIPQELSRLSRLQNLNLSRNSLSGVIPSELSHCFGLQVIDMSFNMLGGYIPIDFGSLLSLHTLHLRNNSIIGRIPSSLANMSSLNFLGLSGNLLSGGIPPSLGQLSVLEVLRLTSNNLEGSIPPSLWNLSSLGTLGLGHNQLKGLLPKDLGQTLPHLNQLSIHSNKMHGSIPISMSNASQLSVIQLHDNNFSGRIPPNIGSLQHLRILILRKNQLEAREPLDWSFLISLSNCTNLEWLQIGGNNLGGLLPKSIANISTTLQVLSMGDNSIEGSIPQEIGNLVNLTVFAIGGNFLSGRIPTSIGLLKNLHVLDLSFTNFFGEIPSTMGNLSQLYQLYLDFNNFNGSIPASLGKCKSLDLLNLNHNKLTGTIPKEVFSISSLTQQLSFEENQLSGTIPSEIGSLINIGGIWLSGNKLSGEIPNSLGKCQVLQILYLGRNFFEGSIPTSLSALRGLQELDLSHNNLSGEIPTFLGDFPDLHDLNLSFNNFDGEVPRKGVFKNKSEISVLGNDKLCGGDPVLHLPLCAFSGPKKNHKSLILAVIISIFSGVLCLFLLFLFVASRRWIRERSRRKPRENYNIKEQHISISYAELVKATNGFSEENLIGSGTFGSVYRGTLDDHKNDAKVIAVKVFNLQQLGALKSFIAECDAFRNIRHRNLIKILTACSSVDFKGNDFKAMVFDFKPNGSLESWLHPEGNGPFGLKTLKLIQRINIAMDVASALEYLHHHGEAPIIHCDLKPSNILLDDDMTALVSDFGLARFINKPTTTSYSSFGIKGTIGYIAPECGMTNIVSIHGDVYSYGILLMELFTGKRPTDGAFKEGLTLRTYVKDGLYEGLMSTMDECLLANGVQASDHSQTLNHAKTFECVSLVLRIGLICTNDLPTERMEIKKVRNELNDIKNQFFGR